MNKLFSLLLLATIALWTIGCTKSDPAENILDACEATTWNLTAGQTIDVGSVTVSNDQDSLYVEYKLDNPGACFGTLHVWVGRDLSTLPRNQEDILIPGQFPYTADATNKTTYTFSIPLTDFAADCNDSLFIVTHAEVDVDCNASTPGNETAFGGDVAGGGPRWWFYSAYSICCENNSPNGDCQEETAYGGTAAGSGPAWWFYFDTQGDACQTIWAGQNENAGQVCYSSQGDVLTINLANDWELADVDEPVKVEGYDVLPGTRPAAGLFTLYKGAALTVNGIGSRYYVIHLDVKKCE